MIDSNDLKEKLKEKLREVFQFENEDLDFGIYRIMNYKREEVERFIEEELIKAIGRQLELISEEERKEIKERLDKISSKSEVKKYLEALERKDEERARIYREDFAKDIGEYEKLKSQLEEIRISEELEREIYNHLINFFSRYYDNGDFIGKRRYGKNEKYVVPYNGEEVYLYWANKEQYYIKTTEYFRRYTFSVEDLLKLTVNFRVVEAEEEKGNIKSPEKKFFILNEKVFDFNEDINELNIYFEYRGLTEDEEERYKQGNTVSQDKINEETIKILKEKIPPQNSLARSIFLENEGKTLIEKHLYRYTRRNTTDYFIHKDLKGFLERELDFYIKNEFLQLEDLQVLEQSGYFDKLRLYLIGVRAFRNIALKIIEFLAQIENFQKKIWEKRKFVIDTHYVITLDKIKEYAGEEFLESILNDILSNKKQLEEWKELFEIEVKDRNDLIINNTLLGKEWKKLPIDTRYFDEEFKWKLLASLSEKNDLDNILDGILIKSENFQALNLILNKYYERVQTIYIDPPFNKEQEADYLYKVGYKDATWITMLENRIRLGRDLLNERGSIFVRCDYNGNMYVRMLLKEIFGEENFRNEIILNRFQKSSSGFTSTTESLFLYSATEKMVINSLLKPRICIYCKQPISPRWTWAHSAGESKEPRYFIVDGQRVLLYPPKGRHWTNNQEEIDRLQAEGRIRINKNSYYIDVFGNRVNFIPEKLQSDNIGLDNNWTDIPGYEFGVFSQWKFSTENSEILLKRVIESTSNEGDLVMDFFLGSGTTTAVAHKLKRKWIGIEMGEHFWTVVLPRMKKVLFYDKSGISKEEDVKENYNEKKAGGFFKYHTIEQYEDALENIEFEKQENIQLENLLQLPDYFVKYMLDWETKNSNTFLNLEKLRDPFNYKLKIMENYQLKKVNVDVIETFNYLFGLNINRYRVLDENGRRYVFVFGEKEGRRIVIVWRSVEDIDFEKDKEVIEDTIRSFNPDEIYINGDAIVKGFKVIEPLFKSLMFDKVIV